jgi:hypothetical protein
MSEGGGSLSMNTSHQGDASVPTHHPDNPRPYAIGQLSDEKACGCVCSAMKLIVSQLAMRLQRV